MYELKNERKGRKGRKFLFRTSKGLAAVPRTLTKPSRASEGLVRV